MHSTPTCYGKKRGWRSAAGDFAVVASARKMQKKNKRSAADFAVVAAAAIFLGKNDAKHILTIGTRR